MSFKTKRNVLIIVSIFLVLYAFSLGPIIRYGVYGYNTPAFLGQILEVVYYPHFIIYENVKAYSEYLDRCEYLAKHGDLEYPPRSRPKNIGSICDEKRNPCGCGNKSGEERAIYSAVFDSLFDLKTDKGPVRICDSLMIKGDEYPYNIMMTNIMKIKGRPRSINKNMVRMLSLCNCCPCALDSSDINCRMPYQVCSYDDITTDKFLDTSTNQYISFKTFIKKYGMQRFHPKQKEILTKINKDTVFLVLSNIALMKNKREGLISVRKYHNKPDDFVEYIFLLGKRSEKWYVKAKWTLFEYSQQMVKL